MNEGFGPGETGLLALRVAAAVLPLALLFTAFQLLFLKLPRREIARIATGTALASAGLFLFLMGVNIGFLPYGRAIGEATGALPYKWLLAPFGILLGFVTTWWVSLVVLVAVSMAVDGDVTWWSSILILLALLLLVVCPFLLLAMLVDGRRHFDEGWAKSLRRQDLAKQGWDTLWTDEELAGLTRPEVTTPS